MRQADDLGLSRDLLQARAEEGGAALAARTARTAHAARAVPVFGRAVRAANACVPPQAAVADLHQRLCSARRPSPIAPSCSGPRPATDRHVARRRSTRPSPVYSQSRMTAAAASTPLASRWATSTHGPPSSGSEPSSPRSRSSS
eukprot:6414552-Prymnesium_polylepis.1